MTAIFTIPDNISSRSDIWKGIDKTHIPHKPGVYIYKDQTGRVIYVGKAIDLYHRIASYFRKNVDSLKTENLVANIKSCETIEVYSELEALILEANLIKKYRPEFNIKLMDDKDYLYIKITNEEFPRILTARKHELNDAKEYFGPFPSATTVKNTLKKLRRVFPWCTYQVYDHYHLSGDNKRPCFYYHLGLCPGTCAGKISKHDYGLIIKRFSKFMNGQHENLEKELEKEMDSYSKKQQYEQAQSVKKTLEGIRYLTQPNNGVDVYLQNPNFIQDQNQMALKELQQNLNLTTLPERIECYDISNLQGQYAVGSLVVLTNGEIDKKWYRKFKILKEGKPDDVAMMKEMVGRRMKHPEWPTPNLILVDGGKGQVSGVEEQLRKGGWQMPVFGLAKRMEWLYSKDAAEIKLSRSSLSLRLLQKIRDEAHRFAIGYHRKLRDTNWMYNK